MTKCPNILLMTRALKKYPGYPLVPGYMCPKKNDPITPSQENVSSVFQIFDVLLLIFASSN
jgi:hypothetical protein